MPSNQLEAILLCGCGCGQEGVCCPSRCHAVDTPNLTPSTPTCSDPPAPGESPFPTTLAVEIGTDSEFGCFALSGTVTLIQPFRWAGQLTGSCQYCCPNDSTQTCTRTFTVDAFVTCGTPNGWLIEFDNGTPATPPDTILTQVDCNPILLTGNTDCFAPALICLTPGPGIPVPPPVTHPNVCLSVLVSETL